MHVVLVISEHHAALHEKNGFAEISKNLTRHRSENNFVWIIKIIM